MSSISACAANQWLQIIIWVHLWSYGFILPVLQAYTTQGWYVCTTPVICIPNHCLNVCTEPWTSSFLSALLASSGPFRAICLTSFTIPQDSISCLPSLANYRQSQCDLKCHKRHGRHTESARHVRCLSTVQREIRETLTSTTFVLWIKYPLLSGI